MSQPQLPATPKNTSSTRKRPSSFDAPFSKRHRITASTADNSEIQCWLASLDQEEETNPLLKWDLCVDSGKILETSDREIHETTSPVQTVPEPKSSFARKLTEEALKELVGNSMPSPSTPSEQSSPEVSNITPHKVDYAKALRYRGAFPSVSGPGPDDLFDFEKGFEIDGEIPDLKEATITCIHQLQLEPAKEKEGAIRLFPKILPIDDEVCNSMIDSFALDESWDEGTLLKPFLQPGVAVPKPDRAFGMAFSAFDLFPKAVVHLGCAMRPVPSRKQFCWPYLTVEFKGESGCMRTADMQNLHNGAVMLNNMLILKRAIGMEGTFFNQIRAVSIQFGIEFATVSCYWAAQKDDEVNYYGRRVKYFFCHDPQAGPRILNALKWIKKKHFDSILEDMKTLETRLQDPSHGLTPPASRSGRGTGSKRKNAQNHSDTKSKQSKKSIGSSVSLESGSVLGNQARGLGTF